jgi:hypothetical protein
MDIVKVEPGSSSETCPASCHDEDPIFDIKVEEGPIPITFEGIKTEHEVSCMCACPMLNTFHKYPELFMVFIISVCLHLTSPFHWMDFSDFFRKCLWRIICCCTLLV